MAVKNIAVPAPSAIRSNIHAKMKLQVEASKVTNLHNFSNGNIVRPNTSLRSKCYMYVSTLYVGMRGPTAQTKT